MRINHSSGSDFEQAIGYSRCVEIDEWVVVSGTTGYNYTTMSIPTCATEQTEQALENIELALAKTSLNKEDIIKVNYIYPNPEDFKECWSILSNFFNEIRPAATMISAQLVQPEMKVEIEVWDKKTRKQSQSQ